MPRIRSIFDPAARRALLERVDALRPGAHPRWGGMTVDVMVVHLSEGYRLLLEATDRKPPRNRLKAAAMRWYALHIPLPWPRGAPAPRPIRAGEGLRPAGQFEREVRELREQIERFARAEPDGGWPPHHRFGRLSRDQWGRWAWRHADHHLRQFGV